MSAHLCGVQPGDEVIMASYTFSSTANAFAGRGARICSSTFAGRNEHRPTLIEEAITDRTKAIADALSGVACEMDKITDIAPRHWITIVEIRHKV